MFKPNKNTLFLSYLNLARCLGGGRLILVCFFLTGYLSSCTVLKTHNVEQTSSLLTQLKTTHTLDVYSEGNNIHALFSGINARSQQLELRYMHSLDAGKTWTKTVAVNQNMAAVKKSKRGNDFQVASHGDNIMAIWRTQGGEPWVGVIAVALSNDKGKTWHKVVSPVSNKYAKIDQGYFDLTADQQGKFHIVWLDDREEAGDTQQLHYARFDGKQWESHNTLEATVCTCCWSSIDSDALGSIHVMYRNDSPRDMMLISSHDNGATWQKPKPVWSFGWKFVGCPHQGGGLASEQNGVLHNIVWNGEDDKRGLYYQRSDLMDKDSIAITPIGGSSSASGDIATLDKGNVGVVYTIREGEATKVKAKISNDNGLSWSKALLLSQEHSEPSHPRIVGTLNGFRFFWTEWQKNGDAVVVMVKLN